MSAPAAKKPRFVSRAAVVVNGEEVARFTLPEDAKFFAEQGVAAGMFPTARVTVGAIAHFYGPNGTNLSVWEPTG